MALTLITREMFQGVGTLNAGTPGAFEAVSGSLYKRPVGPRTSAIAAPGWSVDTRQAAASGYWNLSGAYASAYAAGALGFWIRWNKFGGTSSTAVFPAFCVVGGSNANPLNNVETYGVNSAGTVILQNASGTYGTTTPSTVALHTWYWFQIEWTNVGTVYVLRSSLTPLGGSEVVLGTRTRPTTNILRITVGNLDPTNAVFHNARIGGVGLYSIGSIGELTGPDAALLPPVAGRQNWYLSPLGNDSNDGITPETAWLTAGKFNVESANAGIFSSADYESGDILNIDSSSAPVDIGSEQLLPQTGGLTIQPLPGQTKAYLKAWKDVSGGVTSWTQYDSVNYPNIWMTTDGGASDLTGVVIWEDEKWLNHFTGAAITNVRTSMNANSSGFGSFFSDGTNLYLVASNNSNPNTNGKTYTRSRYRTGGGSAVYASAPSMALLGLDIRKTCLARSSDNDPYTAYAIQGDGNWGGVSLVQDCYTSYASKHAIGFTDSGSNRTTTIRRCQAEQGTPYSSQSPFVDYNGNASATGNRSHWIDCINLFPNGTIGSAVGSAIGVGSPTYLSHNNGTGTQFAEITFRGCNFGGSINGAPTVLASVVNCIAFGVDCGSSSGTLVSRCRLTGRGASVGNTGATLTMKDCLVTFENGAMNASFSPLVAGTLILDGNTFDLRGFAISDNVDWSMYLRYLGGSPVSFTFRNNVLIVPTGKQWTVMRNFLNTDTIAFNNNAYILGTSLKVIGNYNDGTTTADRTFAQWQALGKDASSFTSADLKLSGSYYPLSGSPVIGAGTDRGQALDYSGRTVNRISIGALEMLVSSMNAIRNAIIPAIRNAIGPNRKSL